jgi:hypothetical protein
VKKRDNRKKERKESVKNNNNKTERMNSRCLKEVWERETDQQQVLFLSK